MTGYIDTPTIGEILQEEFMEPMDISAYKLAQEIHVPVFRNLKISLAEEINKIRVCQAV